MIVIGAILVICLATTTPESRAAARQDMRKYEPWCLGFVVLVVLAIAIPELMKK